MKKLMLIVGLVCFYSQAEENPLGKLSFQSVLGEGHKSFDSRVSNQSEYDIYCRQIVFRADVEDPEKYLLLGEKTFVKENVYLRGRQEDQRIARLSFTSREISEFLEQLPTATLKNLRLDSELSDCLWADFYAFAFFARKNNAEELTMDLLFRVRFLRQEEQCGRVDYGFAFSRTQEQSAGRYSGPDRRGQET